MMQPIPELLHPWDMTPEEAAAQQSAMRRLVSLTDGFGEIKTVAGVDLSLNDEKNEGHAIVVVLSYPDITILETRYATAPLLMPYISGLLSFRESPIALQAFAQLQTVPDLIFVDGQGQAHPRGFGIACHLGVLLDVPSIGVAKSRLYGEYDATALPDTAGASVPLWNRTRKHIIGTVLRMKPRTNPLFVSPGHKVSVESAARLVQDCGRGYRLPEPTRLAHNLITDYKKTGAAPIIPPAAPRQATLF
jgi:deoxyribonuclease V